MIAIAPSDTAVTVPALSNIGDMYHEMGNDKEAFNYYKKALKINPDYAPALNNYAYFLSLMGKSLKKACAMSKKTIDQEPDNATYLDTYGWLLHLLGKDQDAKAVFKHALIYGAKDSATSLEHYAEVLESLGENDLAKVYRTQAANKKAEGKE
jgi:Tfp pilus assembly protein PilF